MGDARSLVTAVTSAGTADITRARRPGPGMVTP